MWIWASFLWEKTAVFNVIWMEEVCFIFEGEAPLLFGNILSVSYFLWNLICILCTSYHNVSQSFDGFTQDWQCTSYLKNYELPYQIESGQNWKSKYHYEFVMMNFLKLSLCRNTEIGRQIGWNIALKRSQKKLK